MLRRSVICFISLSCFISAHGESSLTPTQLFINTLKSASTQDGIQVGIIIDPHKPDSVNEIYAKIITLPEGSDYTAYKALLKSGITLVKHPKFNNPPKVLILSLMGITADSTTDGTRTWTFFTLEHSTSKWILPKKTENELASVAEAPVSDGDIIGFSRTAWIKVNKEDYTPKDEPRIPSNLTSESIQ